MARKGTSTKPENETKNQAFKRLAGARTRKVLDGIAGLTKMTRGNYEWTEAEAGQIVTVIQDALKGLENGLLNPSKGGSSKSDFTL